MPDPNTYGVGTYGVAVYGGSPPPETPESFRDKVYAALEPMKYAEEEQDDALLKYVGAIGQEFQEVENYARDDPITGKIGWSILVDVDRAPDPALPWLGQFVGVQIPPTTDETTARNTIKNHPAWNRGTVDSMLKALKDTLIGNKFVIFIERNTDPYKLTVVSRLAETPDQVASYNALISEKPAGIILDYHVVNGRTWLEVRDTWATWGDVRTNNANWDLVRGYTVAAAPGSPLVPSDSLIPTDTLAPGG